MPLLLGIYRRDGVNADTNRLIKWGIDVCSRRNDVGNLLWFLYSAIFLHTKIGSSQCTQCLGVANELVDLVLFHGRAEGLFSVPLAKARSRYRHSGFGSSAWITLYEVERHGWDTSAAFTKIGTADDEGGHYDILRNQGVEFYLTDRQKFSVSAFDGWNLTDDDFQVRDWDAADLRELLWADGRDWENYE